MRVSIIIPTYNEEDVILACLESLEKQKFDDFEIIVVDDGSGDKTLEVLSKFKIQNSKIKVFEQKHKGAGSARNLGAKNAKGQVLVFVDSDMTFDKDFVKDLTKPIFKGLAKGTFSKNEFVSNWDNVWARCYNWNQNWEKKRRHPKKHPKTQKVFRAILKSEFDKAGGFDLSGAYTDDWSLSDKLGYEANLAQGAIFYHKNPSGLKEVFSHAQWVGSRKYKLGVIGRAVAFIRASLPISIAIGLLKSIYKREPRFIFFKIIYDLGLTLGIIKYNANLHSSFRANSPGTGH